MVPTPQDFAQVLDQSRLPMLDWLSVAIPGATLVLVAAALAAIAWMCWSETGAARSVHSTRLRHP